MNKIDGQRYNFSELTDIAVPMNVNENNYLELDMMIVDKTTGKWRCASGAIITWVPAAVFEIKSHGNFTIPVTVNINADGSLNTIIHFSQIVMFDPTYYAFGGIGKIRVTTR